MSDATKYTSKLHTSRVLVIGGSSGIGYAVAEACLEHGAHVAISSSNAQRVEAAVSKLHSSYPSKKANVHGLTVDLGSADTLESELESVLKGAAEKFGTNGRLDHVIFTAGDALATIKLQDMTMANVLQAGQVRFFAPLLLAKFLPQYLEQSYKSSYTITTGSISEKPIPDWSVVASYAGGHHAMVRNLALDLRPVRVNGISPGVVETPLWRMSDEERAKMMDVYGKKLATGRAGQPEDVAESFLGVVRDWNCTGSMVRTDGGSMLMTG
ncbi:NAD(P)-binding protein [Ophiobolus disseminans]|uniref:NAD(P)-binding protein n=1 Tax=Ophiobolus disseminans TaxID=1469910 RepID=A0A6A6ZMG4_9PLEO|nr:NAD(P)-binding protein [Ophiobolus disseminans]